MSNDTHRNGDASPDTPAPTSDGSDAAAAAAAADDFEGFFEGAELSDAMPEVQVSDSLQAALRQMREDVEALDTMEPGDRAVAAEQIAERAAALDEQIAHESRRTHG